VKLLLYQNLSYYRLVEQLELAFPRTRHVDTVSLPGQADRAIWNRARDNGFIIVSKDDDFRQLSFLKGAPPKVNWLPVGNAPTSTILRILTNRSSLIDEFVQSPTESLLILKIPQDLSP